MPLGFGEEALVLPLTTHLHAATSGCQQILSVLPSHPQCDYIDCLSCPTLTQAAIFMDLPVGLLLLL